MHFVPLFLRTAGRPANSPMDAHELISRVTDWSYRDDRVIACGLCGSYARGDAGPDSDVDFCILTPEPRALLEDRAWIDSLGDNARIAGAVEDYRLVQSLRVFYGSTEAEFGVTDATWAQVPIDKETAAVINNGFQILYDPDGDLDDAVVCALRRA